MDPFASPPVSRPESLSNVPLPSSSSTSNPANANNNASNAPGTPSPLTSTSVLITPGLIKRPNPRMRSHVLPYEPGTAPKPWRTKPTAREKVSYWIVYFMVAVGVALGAIQCYFTYVGVEIDKAPLCLVFDEDFSGGEEAVFGQGGKFKREVDMSGFGNGQFEMTTDSSNNSFIQDGILYLVPTLTSDVLGDAAVFGENNNSVVYNITGCTFNQTRPNNGFIIKPDGSQEFDAKNYYKACSAVSNSTAGTVINPIMSSRISTQATGSIRFGKVEVKARMPRGDWLWPAIWMLPRDSIYGAWPRSGEIDIVESRGNGMRYTARGRNTVQGALNWGPNTFLNSVAKSYSWWTEKRVGFDEDFHTYVLEWTEKWIRISVDTRLHTLLDFKFDRPFFEKGDYPSVIRDPVTGALTPLTNPWSNASSTPTANAAPFDQEFFLILNVAVGGTSGWFPEGQGDKPWLDQSSAAMRDFARSKDVWYPTWPQDMSRRGMAVDYVKMWKHC